MSVSEKDIDFMIRVAEFFQSTRSGSNPNGSIRKTAVKFGINRNKVRKILVTMGAVESPITETAIMLRQQGMSIKEIARDLGVSVATVSTALPYADKVDNTLEPSCHALSVRKYREYEKKRSERQAGRDLKKQDKHNVWEEVTVDNSKNNEKEWQKDIKMSYTEAYHRPHRTTWEDMDEMREAFVKKDKDNSDLYKEMLADLELMRKKNEEEEDEYFKLLSKKVLTEKEKQRMNHLGLRTGHFPGALNDRNRGTLEKISGDRLPPEPMDVMRLHLELFDEFESVGTGSNDVEILKKYGKVEYGNRITRDIIVPCDIPLYALHYVIQRAFGWQNSHLRQFELPDERFKAITNNNAAMWSCMVGVLFRSPLMNESDIFWADDYNGGSFKNWLRKKYTGPYLSQCHGEGLLSCQEDMMGIDMSAEYYILYLREYNHETGKYDGDEYISFATPAYDHIGNKIPEPKPWDSAKVPYRVEVVRFEEIPSSCLVYVFEENPAALLERLPICEVLAASEFGIFDVLSDEERKHFEESIMKSGDELFVLLERYIKNIFLEQIDSPYMQVGIMPVTDTLFYNYDFGDNWKIKITASMNCTDLVESGRITQAELDRANVKCREVYRPVLIAKDGEMLVEDVGGLHGFVDFLTKINPELKGLNRDEKEAARKEKKEYLEWARSLGWNREKSSNFNLL